MPNSNCLRQTIVQRARRALILGKMVSIANTETTIDDGGVAFIVRIASGLERKQVASVLPAQQRQGTRVNPFLPVDDDMVVAELSPSHLLVLNKFNVIDQHLLIVTRAFEPQERLLTPADFEALWACLAEVEGLGFYNGGALAGASQPHKHVQLVPLPLGRSGPPVPMFALIPAGDTADGVRSIPDLPFRHAFARVRGSSIEEPRRAAAASYDRYRLLLAAVGISGSSDGRQSAPYNLLVTRELMMVVPRTTECFAGISINALGFAGSLFVRDSDQLATIERARPLAVLKAVAVSLS